MPQYVMKNARRQKIETRAKIVLQYKMKMRANNGHNKCDKKAQANIRNFSPAKSAYLLALLLGPHSLNK